MAVGRILGFTKVHTFPDSTSYSERRFYRMPLRALWPWLRSIDFMFAYAIKIDVPLALGYYVVCDRFVYDMLVDLMVEVDDPELFRRYVGHLLLAYGKKASYIFLMQRDLHHLLIIRRNMRSFDYFSERERLYGKIANKQMIVLDTDAPFDEIQERIVRSVNL
jgi:thymidylate kinase